MKIRSIRLLFICTVLVSFGYYYKLFYKDFPILNAENYQYGYQQIAETIKAYAVNYQRIIVDPRFGGSRFSGVPHLYLPYYMIINPEYLQKRKDTTRTDFWKFEIREIDWENERLNKGYLYIVPEFNKPVKSIVQLKETIPLPNGSPAFSIYEY